jgi:hypothetical protein
VAFPFDFLDVGEGLRWSEHSSKCGAAAAGDGSIIAQMPGTVLDVRVEVGQSVVEGEVLGVMEAMKMELPLKAPSTGPSPHSTPPWAGRSRSARRCSRWSRPRADP